MTQSNEMKDKSVTLKISALRRAVTKLEQELFEANHEIRVLKQQIQTATNLEDEFFVALRGIISAAEDRETAREAAEAAKL